MKGGKSDKMVSLSPSPLKDADPPAPTTERLSTQLLFNPPLFGFLLRSSVYIAV